MKHWELTADIADLKSETTIQIKLSALRQIYYNKIAA